ncbi:hypothetical protein B0H19DRAFT_922155, partial [Mycena capillaripes]
RLAARPILTGALLKASLYNPPLPRMKPQPPVIGRIIMTRMRTRDRRFARQEQLNEDCGAQPHSRNIWPGSSARIASRGILLRCALEWQYPVKAAQAELSALLARDTVRSQTPPSPGLLEILHAAHREKVANEARERSHERRGEMLPSTVACARKGPSRI